MAVKVSSVNGLGGQTSEASKAVQRSAELKVRKAGQLNRESVVAHYVWVGVQGTAAEGGAATGTPSLRTGRFGGRREEETCPDTIFVPTHGRNTSCLHDRTGLGRRWGWGGVGVLSVRLRLHHNGAAADAFPEQLQKTCLLRPLNPPRPVPTSKAEQESSLAALGLSVCHTAG